MSTGQYSLVQTVVAGDVITAAERNAEHQNHISHAEPDGIGAHSDNATEMQATTDPYPGAVESLATDLAGEIERLRYVIKQLGGGAQWYTDPIGAANLKRFMNAGATAPEWASGISLATFTRTMGDAAGTYNFTGLTFKPSAVVFLSAVSTSVGMMSAGFDDGTVHYGIADIYNSSANAWLASASFSILAYASGTDFTTGYISAMLSNGFTITWGKTGTPIGTITNYALCLR